MLIEKIKIAVTPALFKIDIKRPSYILMFTNHHITKYFRCTMKGKTAVVHFLNVRWTYVRRQKIKIGILRYCLYS